MGVAAFAVMTDCAHDMSLIALIVDGVGHRFSIHGESCVVLSIGLVPAPYRTVEMHGVHSDEDITDDGQARDDVSVVLVSAAETLAGLLSEAFGPIRDSQVAAHATQRCAGGKG